MSVVVVPGLNDSNNKKCRSKDYIGNICRGIIMYMQMKMIVLLKFKLNFSGIFL
jgi:hypothetical protein